MPASDPPVDLDALAAMLAAATPGPWRRARYYRAPEHRVDAGADPVARCEGAPGRDEANAALTAAAVTALPALLAELRALRAVADAARALVDALPRCDECDRPATHAFERGAERWCWVCAPDGCPSYPREAPLHALMELIGGEPR